MPECGFQYWNLRVWLFGLPRLRMFYRAEMRSGLFGKVGLDVSEKSGREKTLTFAASNATERRTAMKDFNYYAPTEVVFGRSRSKGGHRGHEALLPNNRHARSIPELIGRRVTADEIGRMAEKCSLGRTVTVDRLKVLAYDDMKAIYDMANR